MTNNTLKEIHQKNTEREELNSTLLKLFDFSSKTRNIAFENMDEFIDEMKSINFFQLSIVPSSENQYKSSPFMAITSCDENDEKIRKYLLKHSIEVDDT